MELIDVVRKLIGPVDPIGETQTDDIRSKNLGEMIDLVDRLITDIVKVASYKTRAEYSMNRSGKRASEFLDDLAIGLSDT